MPGVDGATCHPRLSTYRQTLFKIFIHCTSIMHAVLKPLIAVEKFDFAIAIQNVRIAIGM
eukprot:595741-Pleurochrysis_carterae.AAC.1